MPHEAKHPVATTKKTIRIVEALSERDGARVTELADELGMSKSVVHNHLSTLREEEFVVRDGSVYRVGLRFLEFGGYARSRARLYRVAEPEVERLAERTGELANLVVEQHDRGVFLVRAEGNDAVDLDIHEGARYDLHVSAAGKAILAHLPADRVERLVERRGLAPETPRTVTDREALFDQLETVRDRGYAIDDEELLAGLRSVAAPLTRTDGTVVGAISVCGPTTRMSNERFTEEMPDYVRSAANVVELSLTGS